jgi:hypothetical protein
MAIKKKSIGHEGGRAREKGGREVGGRGRGRDKYR